MTNRNFGKFIDQHNVQFAPIEIKVNKCIVINPTTESYLAADNGPWLPVKYQKPAEKVGVYYVANGWEQHDNAIWRTYEERPFVAPPTVYKVEEIIYQLISVGKLQAVKQVVGDYWELLTMREYVEKDNQIWSEAFPQICAQLIAAGVFASQEEIDSLLAKCRDGYIED